MTTENTCRCCGKQLVNLIQTQEVAFIYEMSWFESPRHHRSHTHMYFAKPQHTLWGFNNPLCRISYIKMPINSKKFRCAIENSQIAKERGEENYECCRYLEKQPIAFIYEMSWFQSPRHHRPHTNCYFAEPQHTLWGFDNPLCRISYIKMPMNSAKFRQAIKNSQISESD